MLHDELPIDDRRLQPLTFIHDPSDTLLSINEFMSTTSEAHEVNKNSGFSEIRRTERPLARRAKPQQYLSTPALNSCPLTSGYRSCVNGSLPSSDTQTQDISLSETLTSKSPSELQTISCQYFSTCFSEISDDEVELTDNHHHHRKHKKSNSQQKPANDCLFVVNGREDQRAFQTHFMKNIMPPILESTSDMMKYRVNYHTLLSEVRTILDDNNTVKSSPSLGYFADYILCKRVQKMAENSESVRRNEIPTLMPTQTVLRRAAMFIKHQWKCRYYCLLDAVDLLYKDYQLLHHASRIKCQSAMFSDPERLLITYADGFQFNNMDTYQAKILSGADPVTFLAFRVSQLLPQAKQNSSQKLLPYPWTNRFTASSAFILDVISQCRLVRLELDRRLAFHERGLYVLCKTKRQRNQLKDTIDEQKNAIFQLVGQLDSARKSLPDWALKKDGKIQEDEEPSDEESDPGQKLHKRVAELQKLVAAKEERFYALERVLREEEIQRRRMHNHLQEITGNIRVFCRVRPSKQDDDKHVKQTAYLAVTSDDKLMVHPSTSPKRSNLCGDSGARSTRNAKASNGIKCFIFDKVFGPEVKQAPIYKEVDDLIISCVDGFNVCIMAYGQTGSGKTHTMMGTEQDPGVNRRAIQRLLQLCNDRKHWDYDLSMSILEVYQDEVFDLLADSEQTDIESGLTTPCSFLHESRSSSTSLNSLGGSSAGRKASPTAFMTSIRSNNCASTHQIKQRRKSIVRILSTQDNELVLQNLTEKSIITEHDVLDCLELGEARRSVGATQLNTVSSRSHMLLLVRVTGEHKLHRSHSRGTLMLADLAGSENVTKSGSVGQRFKEAACINKSLCCLGRVFDALRRRQKPSYRDTKLTYLLKPTLGGDSKCLLIINVRSEAENREETMRALSFGQGALQVSPSKVSTTRCDVEERRAFIKILKPSVTRPGISSNTSNSCVANTWIRGI